MLKITNRTRDTVVADRGVVAQRPWKRLTGLLTRTSLGPGEALLIPRCCSIHTWFMRFPIDVVFVKQGRVVKTVHGLRPFRLAWAAGADTVIELPAGTAATTDTHTGVMLHWTDLEAPAA